MEIVEAGLQVLENEVIAPVTIESIRLMKNGIRSIEEDAFRYANHVPGMQVKSQPPHPKSTQKFVLVKTCFILIFTTS